jgi:hypothetical protein
MIIHDTITFHRFSMILALCDRACIFLQSIYLQSINLSIYAFAAFDSLRLLFGLSSRDSVEAEMRCSSVKLLVLVVLGGGEADADNSPLVIELEHLHAF